MIQGVFFVQSANFNVWVKVCLLLTGQVFGPEGPFDQLYIVGFTVAW